MKKAPDKIGNPKFLLVYHYWRYCTEYPFSIVNIHALSKCGSIERCLLQPQALLPMAEVSGSLELCEDKHFWVLWDLNSTGAYRCLQYNWSLDLDLDIDDIYTSDVYYSMSWSLNFSVHIDHYYTQNICNSWDQCFRITMVFVSSFWLGRSISTLQVDQKNDWLQDKTGLPKQIFNAGLPSLITNLVNHIKMGPWPHVVSDVLWVPWELRKWSAKQACWESMTPM